MDTYKVLGQIKTTGSTVADDIIYNVPTGKQASVSNISITNTSSSAKTYYLAFSKSSESTNSLASNSQKVIISRSISANQTHEINGGICLQQGDQVRINTTSTEIVVHAYGVEIS